MVTFGVTTSNASGDSKSSVGSSEPLGRSTSRRRINRVGDVPCAVRVASRSCGPSRMPSTVKSRPSRGCTLARANGPTLIVAACVSVTPATVPRSVFVAFTAQLAVVVSPSVAISDGVPYSTRRTVNGVPSIGVREAIAARSLRNAWLKVERDAAVAGVARVQSPSASRKATQVGAAAAQYVMATAVSGTGDGETGSSEHATSAVQRTSIGRTDARGRTTNTEITESSDRQYDQNAIRLRNRTPRRIFGASWSVVAWP